MAVEKPFEGKARIFSEGLELHIVIPSPKQILIIIFLFAWIGGWTVGGSMAMKSVLEPKAGTGTDWFIYFWLIGWAAGEAFALVSLVWMISGIETIVLSGNSLSIDRRALGLGLKREYDISQSRNFRVMQTENWLTNRRSTFAMIGMTGGRIGFDYGMKTVRFAVGLDDAEADHVLAQMKQRSGSIK